MRAERAGAGIPLQLPERPPLPGRQRQGHGGPLRPEKARDGDAREEQARGRRDSPRGLRGVVHQGRHRDNRRVHHGPPGSRPSNHVLLDTLRRTIRVKGLGEDRVREADQEAQSGEAGEEGQARRRRPRRVGTHGHARDDGRARDRFRLPGRGGRHHQRGTGRHLEQRDIREGLLPGLPVFRRRLPQAMGHTRPLHNADEDLQAVPDARGHTPYPGPDRQGVERGHEGMRDRVRLLRGHSQANTILHPGDGRQGGRGQRQVWEEERLVAQRRDIRIPARAALRTQRRRDTRSSSARRWA